MPFTVIVATLIPGCSYIETPPLKVEQAVPVLVAAVVLPEVPPEVFQSEKTVSIRFYDVF